MLLFELLHDAPGDAVLVALQAELVGAAFETLAALLAVGQLVEKPHLEHFLPRTLRAVVVSADAGECEPHHAATPSKPKCHFSSSTR